MSVTTGTPGTISGIVAIDMVLTGTIGVCPVSMALKISSVRNPEEPE